jgi:hypothetical protein
MLCIRALPTAPVGAALRDSGRATTRAPRYAEGQGFDLTGMQTLWRMAKQKVARILPERFGEECTNIHPE